MAANFDKRYNRALQVALYLIEGGHTWVDVRREFSISKTIGQKDLKFLYNYGFGKELERNKTLYRLARRALYKNPKNGKR